MVVLSKEYLLEKAKEMGWFNKDGSANRKVIEASLLKFRVVGDSIHELEELLYKPELNKDLINEENDYISKNMEKCIGCFAYFSEYKTYIKEHIKDDRVLLSWSDYLLREKDMDVRPYIIEVFPGLEKELYAERDKEVDRPLLVLQSWAWIAERLEKLREKPEDNQSAIKDYQAELADYAKKYLSCFDDIKGHEERARELLGAEQIWSIVHNLLENGIDRTDCAVELYPGDFEARIYMDKKDTLQTILQSDKLDIYQFDVCLNVFGDRMVADLLRQNKAVLQKVGSMFDDNNSFYIQEKMTNEGWLKGVLNIKQKFDNTKERIKKLSGEKVFEIWQTPLESIEGFQKAQMMEKILSRYYEMIEDLSVREDGDDLCYNYTYGSRSGSMVVCKDFFDVVGTFADAKVERAMQQKLVRLSTVFAYPPRPGKGEKQKEIRKRSFTYIREDGSLYIKKMEEALLENPQSAKSRFFVKNLPTLLSFNKWEVGNNFSEMLAKIAPELIERDQKVFGALWKRVKKDNRNVSNIIIGHIIKDVDSKISQFCLPNLEEFLNIKNGILLAKKYKNTRPDLCERVAKELLKRWKESKGEDSVSTEDDVIQFYKLYPTEEMAKFLEEEAMRRATEGKINGVVEFAKKAESIGLDGYKTALGVLAERYYNDLVKRNHSDEVFEIHVTDGFSYKDLLAELEKLGITNIRLLYNKDNRCCNPDLLLQNKSLKEVEIYTFESYRFSVEHPEKLLEGLPNLKRLTLGGTNYDNALIYESLMKHKPDNFTTLNLRENPMPEEMANELMQKYPDLVVYGGSEEYSKELTERNRGIIRAKHAKNPLETAVKEGVLLEYLQFLPEGKKPKMDDFAVAGEDGNSNVFDAMQGSDKYGKDYYGSLKKAAQLIGSSEMEKTVDLLIAVKQGKVVEYLESLKPEDRPKLEEFYKPNPMVEKKYSQDRTIFNQIAKELKQEERDKQIGLILFLLQVDEKDIANLQIVNNNFANAAKILHQQQKMNEASQISKNAFEQWKAQKGRK